MRKPLCLVFVCQRLPQSCSLLLSSLLLSSCFCRLLSLTLTPSLPHSACLRAAHCYNYTLLPPSLLLLITFCLSPPHPRTLTHVLPQSQLNMLPHPHTMYHIPRIHSLSHPHTYIPSPLSSSHPHTIVSLPSTALVYITPSHTLTHSHSRTLTGTSSSCPASTWLLLV